MSRWLLALLFVSGPACAHPSGVSGFVHPFVGLDHLLAMLAVGMWAAQMGGRWLWLIPASFVAAMALGGLAGFAGVQVPLLEPMLVATVLILGLMVALRVTLRTGGIALAAGCALLHGLAHGAELPAGVAPAGFAAGFLFATALIHAVGVALGLAPLQRLPAELLKRLCALRRTAPALCRASRSRPTARRLPRP